VYAVKWSPRKHDHVTGHAMAKIKLGDGGSVDDSELKIDAVNDGVSGQSGADQRNNEVGNDQVGVTY